MERVYSTVTLPAVEIAAVLTKIDETHWTLDFKWVVATEEKNFSCNIDIGVKSPVGWKPIKIVLQGRIE